MERDSLESESPLLHCESKNEEYSTILHIKNQYSDSDLRYTVEQQKIQITTFFDGTRARIIGFCYPRILEVTTTSVNGKSQIMIFELSKDFNIHEQC